MARRIDERRTQQTAGGTTGTASLTTPFRFQNNVHQRREAMES